MVRYKISPKIIESADGEMEWKQEEDTPPASPTEARAPSPPPPTEKEIKIKKRRLKLSDSQMAALARGKARIADKKRMKILKEKKQEIIERKKEADFSSETIALKKENKKKKSEILKNTKETKIRERLLEKKKKKEWENERKAQWELMREETLEKCENVDDFDELSNHLDTLDDDDIFDDEKMRVKLNKIYDLYKYVPQSINADEEDTEE